MFKFNELDSKPEYFERVKFYYNECKEDSLVSVINFMQLVDQNLSVLLDIKGYRNHSLDYYIKEKDWINQEIARSDAYLRFLCGHPEVDQKQVEIWYERFKHHQSKWEGVWTFIEHCFPDRIEEIKEEEVEEQYQRETNWEAMQYYQKGSCVSCGGRGCLMCDPDIC